MCESVLCFQTVGFMSEINEIQLTDQQKLILELIACVESLRAGNNYSSSAKDELCLPGKA